MNTCPSFENYRICIEQSNSYDPAEWEQGDIESGLKAIPGFVRCEKHPTIQNVVLSVHELSDRQRGAVSDVGPISDLTIILEELKPGQRYILEPKA